MPQVTYGGRQGETVDLVEDPDLIAVRTRSRRSLRAGPVPGPEAALVEGMDKIITFPEVGVEVYRQHNGQTRTTEQVRDELQQAPDIRFAGRVLVDTQSREPVLYTENVFVKFRDDADADHCRRVLLEAGLSIKEQVGYATNAFFAAAAEGTGQEVFAIAQRLLDRDDVEFAHPELVRQLGRRAVSPQQWHLATTTINGQTIAASANVADAHRVTRGEQVTIAIIDTGIDIDHEEFSSPGKIVAPRDTMGGDNDPRPLPFDEEHGTACAGVACADGRFGASGAAPGARLMPIRMMAQLGSQQEANAFFWAANHGADIISCSWGPADGRWFDPNDPRHRVRVQLPDSTRLAIDHAVTAGRGGKGCVIFFAAGNGNESVDLDGYASYANVAAVAACNDRGVRSVYSDMGDAVFCAFPSGDAAFPEEGRPPALTPGIWTTDISGAGGYNPGSGTGVEGDRRGNYTNSFSGTSSACPGAAGVAALVLSQNPALRWREVRDVLRRACDRIDPQKGQWSAEGRSPWYGFGRLNAATAVQLATPEPADRLVISRTFTEAARDVHGAQITVDVNETRRLADLKIQVDIDHAYADDLVVTIVPPAEMNTAPVKLHDRTGGRSRELHRTYDALDVPALNELKDKSVRGSWALEVHNGTPEAASIRRFGLEFIFG